MDDSQGASDDHLSFARSRFTKQLSQMSLPQSTTQQLIHTVMCSEPQHTTSAVYACKPMLYQLSVHAER